MKPTKSDKEMILGIISLLKTLPEHLPNNADYNIETAVANLEWALQLLEKSNQ